MLIDKKWQNPPDRTNNPKVGSSNLLPAKNILKD